jgi:E3 ubiquitin-protein ligase DOA10
MTEACKICWEAGDSSVFISPCFCTGTMKFVHVQCLLMWLSTKNKYTCDICDAPLHKLCSVHQQQLPVVPREDKLPLSLQCALVTMWCYTAFILLLPFYYTSFGGSTTLV